MTMSIAMMMMFKVQKTIFYFWIVQRPQAFNLFFSCLYQQIFNILYLFSISFFFFTRKIGDVMNAVDDLYQMRTYFVIALFRNKFMQFSFVQITM